MFNREFFGAGFYQPNYWIAGSGAAVADEVIGRRPRRGRAPIWPDEEKRLPEPQRPQPAYDPALTESAIAAIQARLDRISVLEGQLGALKATNSALRRSLAAELARLKAIEDDEDDVEALLLI